MHSRGGARESDGARGESYIGSEPRGGDREGRGEGEHGTRLGVDRKMNDLHEVGKDVRGLSVRMW